MNYDNIEKSEFKKGEYVGYGSGAVWRIVKSGKMWDASSHGGEESAHSFYRRKTLNEISDAISGKVNKLSSREENPVPRSSVARAKYIGKKSQITKKAPTERLKKRRAKNTDVGYFPNPVEDRMRFYVEFRTENDSTWRAIARAYDAGTAMLIAKHYADKNPTLFVRVTEK